MKQYIDSNGFERKCSTDGIIYSLEDSIKAIRAARATYRHQYRYSDSEIDKEYLIQAAALVLAKTATSLRSIADNLENAAINMEGERHAVNARRLAIKRNGTAQRPQAQPTPQPAPTPVAAPTAEPEAMPAPEPAPTHDADDNNARGRYNMQCRPQSDEQWHNLGIFRRMRDAWRAALNYAKGFDTAVAAQLIDRKMSQIVSWSDDVVERADDLLNRIDPRNAHHRPNDGGD